MVVLPGTDPETFSGGPLKTYFRKRFDTISPFSLIALGATSYYVKTRKGEA